MAKLREATLEDMDAILKFASDLKEEATTYKVDAEFEVDKIKAIFDMLISSDEAFVGIAEEKGEVIGVVSAALFSYSFSDATFASEIIWYIRPENRGGFAALKMVRALEKWAKQKGALEVEFSPSSGIDLDRQTKFLALEGYNLCSVKMRKRV